MFDKPSKRTYHSQSVHEGLVKTCPHAECAHLCWSNAGGLRTHTARVHEHAMLECLYEGCTAEFRDRQLRLDHHEGVHEGAYFPCLEDGCGSSFAKSSALRKHVNAQHARTRQFVCTHAGCGKPFNNSSNVRRHLKNVHGE